MKNIINYGIGATVTIEVDQEKQTASIIETDVQLFAADNLRWRDENGLINKEGLMSQTYALTAAVTATMHWAEQNGLMKSPECLRLVIAELEKGFSLANAEAKNGEF